MLSPYRIERSNKRHHQHFVAYRNDGRGQLQQVPRFLCQLLLDGDVFLLRPLKGGHVERQPYMRIGTWRRHAWRI